MKNSSIIINGTETLVTDLKVTYTHGGKFHADDVCSVALLNWLGFTGEVKRVFKITDEILVEKDAIIFDIGNGEFDHHDKDAMEYYEDGCPMAAFGKLARAVRIDGETIEELLPGFTQGIAKPIEAKDNGYNSDEISQSHFSVICNSFVPNWNEDTPMDTAFNSAVEICGQILCKQIAALRAKKLAEDSVKAAEVIDGVLILEQFMPWQDYINEDIKGAIYPSLRGGWNLQVAPDKSKPGVTANRAKFNFTEEQKALTTFIHPAGFICAVNTKEDAIKLIPGVELI